MTKAPNKWGKQYWADLGERAGSAAVIGLIAFLTGNGFDTIRGTVTQAWLVIGLPTLLVVLKGLLVNLGGSEPSASLVNVTSNGEPKG